MIRSPAAMYFFFGAQLAMTSAGDSSDPHVASPFTSSTKPPAIRKMPCSSCSSAACVHTFRHLHADHCRDVLQRLVQRPALNGQMVRVDLRTWDGTTYRVRAGGEVLRVLPGHLRELREDDAAIRVQDQGRAVSQARVDYERDRLDAGLRYRPPKTK